MIKKCFLLCLITQSLYTADQGSSELREINIKCLDVALEEADKLMSQKRHSPTITAIVNELTAAVKKETQQDADYIASLIEGDDQEFERLHKESGEMEKIIRTEQETINNLHAAIALMEQQQKKNTKSRDEALEIAQKYATFTAKQAEEMKTLQAQIKCLKTELAWTRAAANQKRT